MVTKAQALTALAQARILLDEAESAIAVTEQFLDEQEEAGTEVDRSGMFQGDYAGMIRDHFNEVEHIVNKL